MSLLFLRLPGHMFTCDRILLAVLKRVCRRTSRWRVGLVTYELIPLAVLKLVGGGGGRGWLLRHMRPHTACGIETSRNDEPPPKWLSVTCDLIPLAVCHTKREPFGSLFVCLLRSSPIASNGRTFFDTQKRLLSTRIDSKRPLAGVRASSCIRAGHFLLQPKPPAFLVRVARLIV